MNKPTRTGLNYFSVRERIEPLRSLGASFIKKLMLAYLIAGCTFCTKAQRMNMRYGLYILAELLRNELDFDPSRGDVFVTWANDSIVK